jgi:hypothetical protein
VSVKNLFLQFIVSKKFVNSYVVDCFLLYNVLADLVKAGGDPFVELN